MRRHNFINLVLVGLCAAGATNTLGTLCADEASAEQQRSEPSAAERHFALKVFPLLQEKCLACHGGEADDIQGEYDLRTRESTLAGGESEEAAVIPGQPEQSPLFRAVTWEELEMPPKENDRLSDAQILALKEWIEAGAVWPSEKVRERILDEAWQAEAGVAENEDGILISTSGGLAKEWTYRRYKPEEVWAFLPVRSEFDQPSIDGFINHKLKQAKLEPAPAAEPAQLVRRATLDLTGLPPTPQQTKKFLQAWEVDAPQAWSQLIDRLLASEAYGERWGQHWLDVARYADTGGLSNDYERSNAWRYRDYVIRSFNTDKPYDQFIVEQIAGDELRPDDPEAIVATGFLRMGPWDTAMIPDKEARQIFLDDVVHSVGQTFLSMPMRCCKCHDHKFDPIPTRDYYRIYATFAATQPAEMPAPLLPQENRNGFDEGTELVNALHKFADDRRLELYNKQEAAAKEWYAEHNLPYKNEADRKNDPEDQKPMRMVGLDEMEQGRLKVREQDEWIWNRRKERYQPLAQSVYNGPDKNQNARKLRMPEKVDKSWLPESAIFTGGAYTSPGEAVTPGVLSSCNLPVAGAPTHDPYALPSAQEGRRLALARWIADANNPLTARSLVNRVWQGHFGRGIVRTPNNFGAKGDAPSHPELLDFLTRQFLNGGMRLKSLHKQIMLSAAYQRSTAHPDLERLNTVDPDNRLWARFVPRRLTAEEIRDSLLLASGELNREVGGLPIMPEINMEVALQPRMIQFSIAPAYQASRTPAQRNRRSIYAYRVRGQADPFMEVMNLPNPNDSCEFRDTAAVAPQASTLFNSDLMTDRSIALALRVEGEFDTLPQQIGRAFQLTLGRQPSGSERRRMKSYVEQMTEYHSQHEPTATIYPPKIVRSLVEEFSGKSFVYDEWLPNFENYVPDPKADTVVPGTRALADLCLMLANSNEFLYVY